MRRTSLLPLLAVIAFYATAAPVVAGNVPGWDKIVAKASRFKILSQFNNEAVLDTETGLVWERNALNGLVAYWGPSLYDCYGRTTGGRRGWRPPTFAELTSLSDPSWSDPAMVRDKNALTPFTNLPFGSSDDFWSSTDDPRSSGFALIFNFSGNGALAAGNKTGLLLPTWCVRGPGGE